jgi:hypothetical protein
VGAQGTWLGLAWTAHCHADAPLCRGAAVENLVRRYEALWLPFSDDGHNVTMLLCALIYEPARTSRSVEGVLAS